MALLENLEYCNYCLMFYRIFFPFKNRFIYFNLLRSTDQKVFNPVNNIAIAFIKCENY